MLPLSASNSVIPDEFWGRRITPGPDPCRAESPLSVSSLLQMLLEEVHGALPGGLGARLVEAAALVAMEAVTGDRVDEDLAVAAALLLDHVHVGHRDGLVGLAEMHHHGHLRLLVGV